MKSDKKPFSERLAIQVFDACCFGNTSGVVPFCMLYLSSIILNARNLEQSLLLKKPEVTTEKKQTKVLELYHIMLDDHHSIGTASLLVLKPLHQ